MIHEHNPLADAVIAGVLFVASGVFYFAAQDEAAGRVERDIVGQAGFPSALAGIAMAATAFIIIRALVRMRREGGPRAAQSVTWQPWLLWFVTVAWVFLFRRIGFFLDTFAFLFAGLWIVGFSRRGMSIAVAASTTVALYLIFGLFLNVGFPLFFDVF